MTAWLGRRSDARVDYREPVRVIWPGEVSGVAARAVNLSPTGILIDAPTPTPCEVGSDVLCDVALPRQGSVLLRGRVAHRRLLSPVQLGMGIEFIDLSPDEAAELRGLVDASDEKPQRVMVRFAGTNQTVRARAVATDAGFRLATSLPFLKLGTALEVSLVLGALPRASGHVSSLALDVDAPDGVPRLLIDVRVDGATSLDNAQNQQVDVDANLDVSLNARRPFVEELVEALGEVPQEAPQVARAEAVPEAVAEDLEVGVPEADQTQLVDVPPRLRPGWALALGMLAGVAVLAAVGPMLLRHLKPAVVAPTTAAATIVAPAPVATAVVAPVEPTPVEPPPAAPAVAAAGIAAPAAAVPAAAVPAPVATAEAVAPAAAAPTPAPVAPHFTIALSGSLAGARRYLLRAPDGIAYNLPHARATIGLGTYEAALPGVRAVWVRPLAGGGTNVRIFFTAARPGPDVTLAPDGITVVAATP